MEDSSAKDGVKPNSKNYETTNWALAQIWCHTIAARLSRARNTMHAASREVAQFFAEYDLFVTSTHAAPPVRIGELALSTADKVQLALIRNLPLQSLFNMMLKGMGNKALSRTPNTMPSTKQVSQRCPASSWNERSPHRHQIVAPSEKRVSFEVATQLEEARPWSMRNQRLSLDQLEQKRALAEHASHRVIGCREALTRPSVEEGARLRAVDGVSWRSPRHLSTL